MFNGTQGKKTRVIILANILMANTNKKYARGTYTKLTHHASYHEQQRQVLCEGVLEVYPTDISAPLPRISVLRPARVPVGQTGTSTSWTLGYNSLRTEHRRPTFHSQQMTPCGIGWA